MAVDVDRALHEVIATHGRRTTDEATSYVQKLKDQKRYVRDVY
jgi:sulfite reductase (NADPH) flavoprotein alpha-component